MRNWVGLCGNKWGPLFISAPAVKTKPICCTLTLWRRRKAQRCRCAVILRWEQAAIVLLSCFENLTTGATARARGDGRVINADNVPGPIDKWGDIFFRIFRFIATHFWLVWDQEDMTLACRTRWFKCQLMVLRVEFTFALDSYRHICDGCWRSQKERIIPITGDRQTTQTIKKSI